MAIDKTIGILGLPQKEINRQLYHMILELQKENSGDASDITGLKGDIKDINDAIGKDNEATTIKGRIYALEHPAQGTG
jgi:hypothetical protein